MLYAIDMLCSKLNKSVSMGRNRIRPNC